ncbi:MAG: GIY-YIG nuclease family protein [Rickettsia endosymbiont of Sergentomyia squamirostris]|uniref:GIY-YIG nuclease family protein n=1 Tax=Candidatus Tisiphia endosymbiont of Sergentomyia squamirostris TaxID=3113639 RepID=A0AAT9G9G3_9RICK
MKQPTVYIMTNKKNGTLYVGITSNLVKRVYEHKNSMIKGFTSRYNCILLVFYEILDTMNAAIVREKQIKAGSRAKKLQLIEIMNLGWHDLYENIV